MLMLTTLFLWQDNLSEKGVSAFNHTPCNTQY